MVRLFARPDADQDFVGWSGDAAGQQNPLRVPMTAHRTITARFTNRPRLQIAGSGGLPGAEKVRLTITGGLGSVYSVLRSANLRDWTQTAGVTNTFGSVQLLLAVTPGGPGEGFRARAAGD